MIDLRSDTVTRPTAGMLAAMSRAPTGDDVFGDDPTVNALQERVAALLGKEAAVFMPSGSMSNQIGLRVHCRPGDEFLCDVGCHIYNYEQGAFAQLSGLSVRTIDGDYGVMRREQLVDCVRPDNDHCVRTKLLCLENTHNRGAGRIYPEAILADCVAWAREHQLATHLDGARLFNAVAATGISAAQYAAYFDTVSICFSKGLGCPIGSMLVGPRDLMRDARRYRKLFGGALRQVGVLAAAADYALSNHVERLVEDHRHAQRLGDCIREIPGFRLTTETIDTNIVIFEIDPRIATAAQVATACREQGLLSLAISSQRIRLVTHLDLSTAQIEQAVDILARVRKIFGGVRQSGEVLPAVGGPTVSVA